MKTASMILLGAGALLVSGLASAESTDKNTGKAPSVRQLVQEGKVIPLDQLLTTHRDRLQGRILDMEVERERGRVIYELEFIDEQGVVREAQIDAQTGEWIKDKVAD